MIDFSKIFFKKSNVSIILIILFCGFFVVISSWKVDRGYNIASDELDFLDINLEQLNHDANFAIEKRNYREAVRNYLEILHHKPNDINTLYCLAKTYAKLKKPELAAKALNYALDAGLKDIPTLLADSAWLSLKDHPSFKPTLDLAKALMVERGETIFTECKILIRGLIRKPDDFDSTKSYPLLILLHGNGANGDSYMNIRNKMGANNFFVAAPQGSYPRSILGLNKPSYSWFYLTKDKNIWKQADPMVVEYINNFIDVINKKYKISGVYLLGHSQGGAVAYLTGVYSSNKVNGILCFGASNPKEYLTPEDLMKSSTKLPVFISHGWDDHAVPFNDAQEAKKLFLKYNYNVTFKPFQGDHWLDGNALTEGKRWIENIEENK